MVVSLFPCFLPPSVSVILIPPTMCAISFAINIPSVKELSDNTILGGKPGLPTALGTFSSFINMLAEQLIISGEDL